MAQKLNNFSYYYGKIGEPSPVPFRGHTCCCEKSNKLILDRISELEEKLNVGLEIDTSDLESIIENKIEAAMDRNNTQIVEAIETLAEKVEEQSEKIEVVDDKVDTVSVKLDDIYSEMFGCCHSTCHTNACHTCNDLNSLYCNCKK